MYRASRFGLTTFHIHVDCLDLGFEKNTLLTLQNLERYPRKKVSYLGESVHLDTFDAFDFLGFAYKILQKKSVHDFYLTHISFKKNTSQIQTFLKKFRSFTLDFDPVGNFVIKLENDTLVVRLHHPTHVRVLEEFQGTSAKVLLEEIYHRLGPFDTSHALYLGYELAKAEYALKNNLTYVQS